MNRRLRSPVRLGLALIAACIFVWGGAGVLAASLAVPPALADALVRDPDVAPCAESAHAASNAAYVSATFRLSTVTLRSGPRMAVVFGGDSCVCGNDNCKISVFDQTGGAYRSVLSGYAIHWEVRPNGSAVIDSSQGADLAYRTSYRWNGRTYAIQKTDMVYGANLAVKPALRQVVFAPGKSSATVTGRQIALGFEDRFELDATGGQTVTLTLLEHDAHFGSFSLTSHDGTSLGTARRGRLAVRLPASGRYDVVVEGADQTFAAYALNVAIH
jgi:hypothetical protein